VVAVQGDRCAAAVRACMNGGVEAPQASCMEATRAHIGSEHMADGALKENSNIISREKK